MSAADLASAAALGVALGVVTGMPLGIINVAIIDAATRGEQRFATGIGLGGALADCVHAAIAFVGVGRVIAELPHLSKLMSVVAAAMVVGYALLAMRRRTLGAVPRRAHGVVTGLLLTLPNPAALAAWIAVAAALWPAIGVAPAIALAIGVGVGSAAWFVLLARWIAALPREHRVVAWLPRIAVGLLVALALGGMTRALLA